MGLSLSSCRDNSAAPSSESNELQSARQWLERCAGEAQSLPAAKAEAGLESALELQSGFLGSDGRPPMPPIAPSILPRASAGRDAPSAVPAVLPGPGQSSGLGSRREGAGSAAPGPALRTRGLSPGLRDVRPKPAFALPQQQPPPPPQPPPRSSFFGDGSVNPGSGGGGLERAAADLEPYARLLSSLGLMSDLPAAARSSPKPQPQQPTPPAAASTAAAAASLHIPKECGLGAGSLEPGFASDPAGIVVTLGKVRLPVVADSTLSANLGQSPTAAAHAATQHHAAEPISESTPGGIGVDGGAASRRRLRLREQAQRAASLLAELDRLLRPSTRLPGGAEQGAASGGGGGSAGAWPAVASLARPRARNEVLEEVVAMVWKLVTDEQVFLLPECGCRGRGGEEGRGSFVCVSMRARSRACNVCELTHASLCIFMCTCFTMFLRMHTLLHFRSCVQMHLHSCVRMFA